MRFRKLRIAWSVACGIACVLLIVLWIISISSSRLIRLGSFGERFHIAVNGDWFGRLAIFNDPDGPYQGSIIGFEGDRIETRGYGDAFGIYCRHFRWPSGSVLWTLQLSIWYPVALTALIAGTPWLRWQFSLRTLLIATTLVAVVLSLIAWSIR